MSSSLIPYERKLPFNPEQMSPIMDEWEAELLKRSAINVVRTNACPTCGKHRYYPQPDGQRKCRNCGATYSGEIRIETRR